MRKSKVKLNEVVEENFKEVDISTVRKMLAKFSFLFHFRFVSPLI